MQNKTIKKYFLDLTIIHIGLMIGQILFAVVSYYLRLDQAQNQLATSNDNTLLYVVVALAMAGVSAGHLLSTSKINSYKNLTSLSEKLRGYQTALIIRYALLEGPSLFAITFYLITGNIIFLTISAMLIVIAILFRPTKDRTILDLELNPEEKKILDNPEAII